MSRVWLRATALALAAIGAVAGLTVYYSSDKVPRCLVSGVDTWRPPADAGTHRYEVVLLNGSACVFDTTQKHRLVGARVTPSLFRVLRVAAAHGRLFDDADADKGSSRVVVLTHATWRGRFGSVWSSAHCSPSMAKITELSASLSWLYIPWSRGRASLR